MSSVEVRIKHDAHAVCGNAESPQKVKVKQNVSGRDCFCRTRCWSTV